MYIFVQCYFGHIAGYIFRVIFVVYTYNVQILLYMTKYYKLDHNVLQLKNFIVQAKP